MPAGIETEVGLRVSVKSGEGGGGGGGVVVPPPPPHASRRVPKEKSKAENALHDRENLEGAKAVFMIKRQIQGLCKTCGKPRLCPYQEKESMKSPCSPACLRRSEIRLAG